jgi:hypothetical protein
MTDSQWEAELHKLAEFYERADQKLGEAWTILRAADQVRPGPTLEQRLEEDRKDIWSMRVSMRTRARRMREYGKDSNDRPDVRE